VPVPVGRDVGTAKGVIAVYAADLGMLALHVPGIDAVEPLAPNDQRAWKSVERLPFQIRWAAERDLRTRVACAESIQSRSCVRSTRAYYTGDTRHAIGPADATAVPAAAARSRKLTEKRPSDGRSAREWKWRDRNGIRSEDERVLFIPQRMRHA
jgi:hypothetical protein